MLTDATSTDDSPTPGYMLNEIAHATVGSYAACKQLIDFLNARLKKNNHNVKYKCCMIIKHVCRSGRADFKKDMARNLDSLKECLQYKGVPDPLRGDEIYKRVREAAKEALDAIFDSQQPVTSSNPNVSRRIQGFSGGQEDDVTKNRRDSGSGSKLSSFTSSAKAMFGLDGASSSYTGNHGVDGGDFSNRSPGGNFGHGNAAGGSGSNASGAAGGSSSSMTGIGNPNFKDPRNVDQSSFSQRMSAAASGLFSKMSSTSSSDGKVMSNSSAAPPPSGGSDYQLRSNREHNFSLPQGSGAWGSGSGRETQNQSHQSNSAPPLPSPGGMGRAGSAASNGDYERGLVESLCEAGGMKAVPQEDKLASFLKSASTLPAEHVGNALLDCMNADAWQSRVKALIVLCRLMNTSNCEEHAVWWADNGEEDLISLQSDSKASVRTQAGKALRLIGLEGEVAAVLENRKEQRRKSHNGKTSQPPKKQTEESLLDFEDAASEQATQSVGGEKDSVDSSLDGGLFSGLSIGAGAPSAPSQQQQRQPVQQQQPQQNAPSVFDGADDLLSLSSANEQPEKVAVTQASPNPMDSASNSISAMQFDLPESTGDHHDSWATETSRSRQSSVDQSSFDFMSGSRSRTSSVDPTGFDFMSSGGSAPGSPPGGMPSGMTPQQQQQQLLHQQQQQQQMLLMQQQQQYYMQQQHLQHHQHQHHQHNPQARQYHPANPQFNVMGGLGMGRKTIPDVNQPGGDSSFAFMGGANTATGQGSSKSNDAFSFVSDTVASKKGSTKFSNRIS